MLQKIISGIKKIYIAFRNFRLVNLNFPPGHFYSPIVNTKDIASRKKDVFNIPKEIKGISLNEAGQLATLNLLKSYYAENTFPEHKTENHRYYFQNIYYCYSDALFLYSMIRHFKPRNIIEVGSGFSSAVMMDTNDQFLNGSIKLTFIEPYPQRLYSLMKPADRNSTTVHEKTFQSIPLETFSQLGENDMLFIDSTHISKAGSDVNKIIFDILPRLKKGVLIHFHDIFYPFEYPESWVLGWKGFGWNETYILKAFLMNNPDFKIEMFNTYLEHFHEEWFKENMPKCLLNTGGSIWIRKVN